MKNSLLNIILIITIGLFQSSCNQRTEDLPAEDYNALFPNKGKIERPDLDYTNMIPTPCDPKEDELNFKYPGVDATKNVRDYIVTLKYQFTEQQFNSMGNGTRSQFDIKYVNEHKKLVTLRSYSDDDGHQQTIENNTPYEISFKVKSGYPLYLSIYGAGYDLFKIKASIQAKSTDGIIITPKVQYETSFYTDGYTEMAPFCEKIILP